MLQYWQQLKRIVSNRLSVVVLDFFFFLFEAFLQRMFACFVVFKYSVIGYSFLKFCFFVAFSHPTFKLYSIFYSKVTSMVVIPNKEEIQQWINYGKEMIKKVLDKVEENAKQTKTTKTEETIQ